MQRWMLALSYAGERFCGWQSQPAGCGVQDALEKALGCIAGEPIAVVCAGRTDRGVHAAAQIVHFDTSARRPSSAWVRGANSLLPCEVRIWHAEAVAGAFHARFSAQRRIYRYLLYNGPVPAAMWHKKAGWYHRPLALAPMQQAAALLLGRHDFSAFRAASCQAKTPVRTLFRAEVSNIPAGWHEAWGEAAWFCFDFEADGFLHHMVRNLVGALIQVGSGAQKPEWVVELLAARNRSLAAPTFSAEGLYFCGADYGDLPLELGARIVRWPHLGTKPG